MAASSAAPSAPGSSIDLYQSGPSTSNQFIRRWQLALLGAGGTSWVTSDSTASGALSGGDSTIDDALRISFKTRQTMLETRGTLDVKIYNIARSRSIQQLRNLYNRVILQAGYLNGAFGTIFDGMIIDWHQGRDENLVDTFIQVLAQDGDAPFNVATAQMNIARGTQVAAAVTQAAQPFLAAGATLGRVLGVPTDTLIRGITHSGMAVEAIKKFGLNPMVANGQLNVAPIQQSFANGPAVAINAETGLIGMAELTGNNGIEFDCNLNPTLQVHQLVQIDNKFINTASGSIPGNVGSNGITTSQGPGINSLFAFYVDPSADGTYEALVIEHVGDSRGNIWQTHVKGWPVGTTLTPTAGAIFLGYGVGPTAGQDQLYTLPPNLPADYAGT
jgi:hypothetical protein